MQIFQFEYNKFIVMSYLEIGDHTAEIKIDGTKNTKDSTSMLNVNEIKSTKAPPLLSKQAVLYYDHIPMPKSVPQWNISSTTLRHSVSAYQFSRSDRFPKTKCNYQDSQQIEIPSTLSKRSSSFGYGKKVNVP